MKNSNKNIEYVIKKILMKTEEKMGEYVYRTQAEYENGRNIECKDPSSKKSVNVHVGMGSQQNIKTRFVSATGRISIAKYKYSQAENRRNPIILIDLKKLKELKKEGQIYDFRREQTRLTELTVANRNLAKADREVVTEYTIPAECCKKIPPLITDILSSLDMLVNDEPKIDKSQKNKPPIDMLPQGMLSKDVDMLINSINDMIMEDRIGELEQIIGKIPFNKLEKAFIERYYDDKMPTLEEVGGEFFPTKEKKELICHCIQREIMQKIFGSEEFLKFLEGKIQEVSQENPKAGEKLRILLAKRNPKVLAGEELSPTEKISATGERKVNPTNLYGISHNLFMNFEVGQRTEKPTEKQSTMNYVIDRSGEIIAAEAKYDCIIKDEGKAPEVVYSNKSIVLNINEIEMALQSKEKQDDGKAKALPIIDVTQMGEAALKGIEASSVVAVNKREKAEMDKTQSRANETDSRQ